MCVKQKPHVPTYVHLKSVLGGVTLDVGGSLSSLLVIVVCFCGMGWACDFWLWAVVLLR